MENVKVEKKKEKVFIRTSRSSFNACVIHLSIHTYIAALFRKSRQNKANFTGTGTLQSGKFIENYLLAKTMQEIKFL